MSALHATPIVVRKRKFLRQQSAQPTRPLQSRQGSNSSSTPSTKLSSTKPKSLDPRVKMGGNGDWTKGHEIEDSTQRETVGWFKDVCRAASDGAKAVYQGVKTIVTPQRKGEHLGHQRDDEHKKKTKKRRVESADFKTPAKQTLKDNTREKLDSITFQPTTQASNIAFVDPKSPLPWDMAKHVEPSNSTLSTSNNSNNYGTNFLNQRHRDHKKNIHAEVLHSVYKGTYASQSPTPSLTPTPGPVIQSGHEAVIKRISSLTETIRTTFLGRSEEVNVKQIPDVIFIKEQRIPAQTPSKFSFKFDTSALTFAKEHSYYQKKLRERQAEHDRIHKEAVEAATKSVSSIIPALTDEEEQAVIDIWKSRGMESHLLATVDNVDVYVRDFQTLADKRWLNDTVIEAFLKTIDSPTVHCFSSFFFTNLENKGYTGVSKWMKRSKKKLENLKRILIPINISSTHWVSAVIDLEHKKIWYMDSLCGSESSHGKRVLAFLQDYLTNEAKKQGLAALAQGYEAKQIVDCPQQPNGFDCGVFTLLNLFHMSQGTELSFDSSESTHFRRVIGHTLLTTTKNRNNN